MLQHESLTSRGRFNINNEGIIKILLSKRGDTVIGYLGSIYIVSRVKFVWIKTLIFDALRLTQTKLLTGK